MTEEKQGEEQNEQKKKKTDIDQLSKRLIKSFFKEFLNFFFPDLVEIINFNTVNFIDKELYSGEVEGDETEADILARVELLDGQEHIVLVHIEIQGNKDTDMPRRMFRYFANTWMEYELPLFAFALFLDEAEWRDRISNVFKREFMGTELSYKYHLRKTKDYYYKDYLKHENPITAALMARMSFGQDSKGLVKAIALKKIKQHKLSPLEEEILSNFIEKLLFLDEKEKKEFEEIIKQEDYKEVKAMMTTWEERGRKERELEIAKKALEKGLEIDIIAEITGLALEVIKSLKDNSDK